MFSDWDYNLAVKSEDARHFSEENSHLMFT